MNKGNVDFSSIFSKINELQNKSGKNEWWDSYHFPDTPNFTVDSLANCARSALFGLALNGGPPVFETTLSKDNKNWRENIEKISNYIKNELAGRLVYSKGERTVFYVFSGGAVFVKSSTSFDVTVIGTSKAHMQVAADLVNTCVK